MTTPTRIALASGVLLALTIAAYADHPRHPPHRRPPPEAFEACAKLKRGDACTVTHDDHTMTGTCDAPPDATELACRPSGPPPEAVEACAKLHEGDRCTVTLDADHSITGTCSKGPNGEPQLACKPDQRPD